MEQNQLKEQVEKGRIQLTLWETVEHYAFLFPILFVLLILLYDRISTTRDSIPVMEFIILLLAIYFIYYQYNALRFKKYRIAHTAENFITAAQATAIELDWKIIELTDDFLLAEKQEIGWQWDGFRITMIRQGNIISANSIVAPSTRSNPFSLGWNKKNIQTFNNNLIRATRGENVLSKTVKEAKADKKNIENESE